MSTKVKICGITNVADGLAAAEAGADMIGLMFYERSPRHISLPTAVEISRALPPFVVKVGRVRKSDGGASPARDF
ncbi:MAG: hypothetical protein WDM76_02495 [Limisphaerales bacterium]